MVRLIKNQTNTISVRVTATIDYTGFSATVSVAGVTKEIPDLTASGIKLEFSAADADAVGEGMEGVISVFNAAGEPYINSRAWFAEVDTKEDAIGFQEISIVLVSVRLVPQSGGGGDIDKKVHEAVEEAMEEQAERFENIDDAKASVNSCKATINDILDKLKPQA